MLTYQQRINDLIQQACRKEPEGSLHESLAKRISHYAETGNKLAGAELGIETAAYLCSIISYQRDVRRELYKFGVQRTAELEKQVLDESQNENNRSCEFVKKTLLEVKKAKEYAENCESSALLMDYLGSAMKRLQEITIEAVNQRTEYGYQLRTYFVAMTMEDRQEKKSGTRILSEDKQAKVLQSLAGYQQNENTASLTFTASAMATVTELLAKRQKELIGKSKNTQIRRLSDRLTGVNSVVADEVDDHGKVRKALTQEEQERLRTEHELNAINRAAASSARIKQVTGDDVEDFLSNL